MIISMVQIGIKISFLRKDISMLYLVFQIFADIPNEIENKLQQTAVQTVR